MSAGAVDTSLWALLTAWPMIILYAIAAVAAVAHLIQARREAGRG